MQLLKTELYFFLPCSPNITVPSQQLPCDAHVSGFYLTNEKGEDMFVFMIPKNHSIQLYCNSLSELYCLVLKKTVVNLDFG